MRIARFSRDGQVSYGLVLPAEPAALAEAGNGANGHGLPDDVLVGHDDDGLIIAELAGHPLGGKKKTSS